MYRKVVFEFEAQKFSKCKIRCKKHLIIVALMRSLASYPKGMVWGGEAGLWLTDPLMQAHTFKLDSEVISIIIIFVMYQRCTLEVFSMCRCANG